MSYVMSVDFLFYGLAAVALFLFRARAPNRTGTVGYMVPGHPWTTIFFMLANWTVVATTIFNNSTHSLIAIGALLLGLPTHFYLDKAGKATERRQADASARHSVPRFRAGKRGTHAPGFRRRLRSARFVRQFLESSSTSAAHGNRFGTHPTRVCSSGGLAARCIGSFRAKSKSCAVL